jgi:hypothetical protein
VLVKFTRCGVVKTEESAEPCERSDAVAEIEQCIDEWRQRFREAPVTPQSTQSFEHDLWCLLRERGRQVLEEELNRLESDDRKTLPAKVHYHKETYRINKKTKLRVATLFGTITLRSFHYLNEEDGEPGLNPLRVRLGIGAGSATPAFAERAARLSVEQTQKEVRGWLLREYGGKWSNDRLRALLRGFRDTLLPQVPVLQQARLLTWLEQAEKSRGRHRPVLAVGRDGTMVPMFPGDYQEASTATVSVYDRRGRRLGTVYLGQMPESKQRALTKQLTALLQATLTAWQGPLPRLAYVTDKGSAQDEYYKQVLKKMKHPQNAQVTLPWEWVLDFYHVCGYLGKIADALFGAETAAGACWFRRMRHWLRDRRQGVSQVLRSATQHLDRRKMTKAQTSAFWKAYGYLRSHRRWMDYQGHRRRGLPIGSGVTEAACKTVFTQRFKRSGMRWKPESGQVILDLRVTYLSGIWEEALAADLTSRELPESNNAADGNAKKGSHQPRARSEVGFAA